LNWIDLNSLILFIFKSNGLTIGLDWLCSKYLSIKASYQKKLFTCQVPKKKKKKKTKKENIDGQNIGLKIIFICY